MKFDVTVPERQELEGAEMRKSTVSHTTLRYKTHALTNVYFPQTAGPVETSARKHEDK